MLLECMEALGGCIPWALRISITDLGWVTPNSEVNFLPQLRVELTALCHRLGGPWVTPY